MRHHFGDLLDRDGRYWTIVPNRERYAYRIGDVPPGSREVTIVTIGKDDENWSRALTLPNLEELTLHEPTKEQLEAIRTLTSIRRLRITHARPRSLEFISSMGRIEELVLEYVSGFTDLSPLRDLKRLRSVHLENLRRVSDFSGLSGVNGLEYLAIHGTLDWQQPIADFEFLRGLPNLEVFGLWQIATKKSYPAMLPALSLRSLKELRLHSSYLEAREYALLEEGLSSKGVEGADWGPYHIYAYAQIEVPRDDVRAHLPAEVIRSRHPDVTLTHDGKRMIDDPHSRWFMFTGRGAGRAKCGTARAEQKCREYARTYAEMRQDARELL